MLAAKLLAAGCSQRSHPELTRFLRNLTPWLACCCLNKLWLRCSFFVRRLEITRDVHTVQKAKIKGTKKKRSASRRCPPTLASWARMLPLRGRRRRVALHQRFVSRVLDDRGPHPG